MQIYAGACGHKLDGSSTWSACMREETKAMLV